MQGRSGTIVYISGIYKFIKDNPCLCFQTPEATSITRARASNKECVYGFFDKHEYILDEYKFTVYQMYSVDETGFSAVHKLSKIIAQKRRHQVDTLKSGERGLTTTGLCCINAADEFIPPLIIFKRERMSDFL